MRGPLQDVENPQRTKAGNPHPGRKSLQDCRRLGRSAPHLRDQSRDQRPGRTAGGAMNLTVAVSNMEVLGKGATSPMAAAGVTAMENLTIPGEASGTARGHMVASPMTAAAIRAGVRGEIATSRTTAVAMEAAVRAGATAGRAVGGNRVLVGRAHPGAVRAPTRPLGPITVGKMTRVRTATSDRAAA